MSALRRALIAVAIMALAMTVYELALAFPTRAPLITRTALDDLFPLWAPASWLYLSPYALAPILCAAMAPDTFRALIRRVLVLLPFQLGAFFLVPTATVAPTLPPERTLSDVLLHTIHDVDGTGNAAPSGHVSFAVVLGWGIYRAFPRARPLTLLYFAGVIFSVLLTGQHHVVDVATGSLLGAAVLLACARQPTRFG